MRRTSRRATPASRISEKLKPRWDLIARELWFGDVLVKRFTRPSPNQEIFLAVFQEEGWPPCIDDPLPFEKGVNAFQRLKAAIRHLNAALQNPVIRFHGNGDGDGIRWEQVEPSARRRFR